MLSSFYVALSSQLALDKRMTTIAANVANVNTIGYRADGVKFESVLSKVGGQSTAYASLDGSLFPAPPASSLGQIMSLMSPW